MKALLRHFKDRVLCCSRVESPNTAFPIRDGEIVMAVDALISEVEVLRKRVKELENKPIRDAEERALTDEELMTENGWTIDCRSPFEISHQDGSTATGQAAQAIVDSLRREYDKDTKANRHT